MILTAAALPAEPWADRPRTALGGLFDRIALHGVGFMMANVLWPPATDFDAIRRAAEPYLDPAIQAHPRAFFSFVDAPTAPATVRTRSRRRIAGGQIVRRTIDAPYHPFHAAPDWRVSPENERLPFEHWLHHGARRATVIALHGLGMGHPIVNAHGLMAQRWFDEGFDVVLPTLPFHGERTPAAARYSGELFMSWNAGRLNEAVRQSIYDLHLLSSWLAARGAGPIGLFGLSLGGYLASVMASLARWPAFVVPMLSPVCIGSVAMQVCTAGGPSPLTLDELQRAHRVHSPLAHRLAIASERALIIGGRGDRVVPPEHAHALWRHWKEPALHWLSGGHTALFRRPRTMALIMEHLRSLGFRRPVPGEPPPAM